VDTIKGLLAQACAETNIQAEDEALFWIAKEATGSMRDAYTLFDQVASFSDGKLSAELIRDKLGLALTGEESIPELTLLARRALREKFLAADLGVTHLIRGVRNPQDFVYEAEMAQVNRDINPNIRTAYIFAPPELAKVSSSTVRSMVGLAQWKARIRPYVHPLVLEALEKRHHQSSCN
jgi:phosphopantetheine adenylyltransferase